MSVLNRFPSRIRFVNPDGTLTTEALRMLDLLVDRVGGAFGDQGEDVFAAPATDAGAASDVITVPSDPGYMAPVEMQPAAHAALGETTYQGSSE